MDNFNENILKVLSDFGFDMSQIRDYPSDVYLDEWLLENNLINRETLVQLYCFLYEISPLTFSEKLNEAEVFGDIYEMEKNRVIIVKQKEHLLIIIDSPFNIMQGLNMIMNNCLSYEFILVTSEEFQNQLNYFKVKVSDLTFERLDLQVQEVHETNDETLYEEINISPIVQKVNYWLNKAIMLKASDIHFEPNQYMCRIRIRIDGKLKVMDEIKPEIYDEVVSRIKIIANLDITQKLLPQDGKISYEFDYSKYDLRISTIPTVAGEKVVIRILNQKSFNNTFEILNYSAEEEKNVKSQLKENSGVIVVTGPTGSGKSTSLYVYLKQLITEENNIVTIEDPVEYSIDEINQIQVNAKIGLTFANLLRNILRQDPNIIMVGEVRDEETAQMAMRAAISGHLVLTTLHSNYAVGSITRLIDMGIPRYLVSSALRMVISQRLVRRLCDKCKKKIRIERSILDKYELPIEGNYYEKAGCASCYYTGYSGRILLSEILNIDDTIREFIMTCASEKKISDYAITHNMTTIEQKLKKSIAMGLVAIDEIK